MSCDKRDKIETSCGCDSVVQQLIDLDITQSQTVIQENENVQLAAIAVALGGGLAKASQKSCQLNDNSQIGKGVTKNTLDFDTEDNMYCRDIKLTADVQQFATGILTQQQTTEQSNENNQLITVAVANNSNSTAFSNELVSQENKYTQDGTVTATNRIDAGNQTDALEDNQAKKQVNPATTSISEELLHKMRLSELSFSVKVAFNHDGSLLEILANDKGEVKIDEIKAANATEVNADSTVVVALDLVGDHLDISADKDGNVFVNGEKI